MSEDYEGLSEDEILEEIAAQYLGVALSNEATIKKIVNEADTKERTFLQNLIEHLKQFISDIKKLLNIYGSEDKTVKAAVETPISQLEYIADEFMRALTEAGKNKKPTTEDGVKYSKQNPKKNSAKNKKSYYNEYATTLMIWANSESTPVGSVLRQSQKGQVRFFLKTETGVLSIDKYEYKKIVSKENEYVRELNIIRKRNADTDNGIYADSGRRISGNVYDDGYTGDAKRSNIADEKFTEKEPESGDFGDMANDGQHNSEISKDISSALRSQKSGYKYSRQRISESWEDIRTLMYENDVHQDVIEEIEDYINKIRHRNLSRETAITEGLIPTLKPDKHNRALSSIVSDEIAPCGYSFELLIALNDFFIMISTTIPIIGKIAATSIPAFIPICCGVIEMLSDNSEAKVLAVTLSTTIPIN